MVQPLTLMSANNKNTGALDGPLAGPVSSGEQKAARLAKMVEGKKAKSSPAEARKRRKQIIDSQRSDSEGNLAAGENASVEAAASAEGLSFESGIMDDGKSQGKKRKGENASKGAATVKSAAAGTSRKSKKTQIKYNPDVPMSKEQLAAWRRECRRVRNRESAAASRQRIRSRITELEGEVDDWKGKYEEALKRLKELQQQHQGGTTSAKSGGAIL